ncbi:response regulator [Cerasicoccus maritimus]|uniref:response regulator n=1 Tax=Cerasicoccus maritimus TaxID=490089 RepID=UPI002852839E|nr:response regulator [Cerasicoccus maritimus]
MSSLCRNVIILLVDDDAGHRHLVKRSLKRLQVASEVIEFEHGLALLEYLAESRKSATPMAERYVILLDIRMPKMSGVEVLQELKSDPVLDPIPVIMVTTTDDPLEMRRCHELGCCRYVTKPVDSDEFAKVLQDLGRFLSDNIFPPTQ